MRFLFEAGAAAYDLLTAHDTWRGHIARMADHLPDGAARILDVGTGPGVSAFVLAGARPAARVCGIDLAARMMARAARGRARRPRLAGRVAFARADVVRLPFSDARFDAATGHSFLYLVPDRAAALREIARVVRPGGRLIFMEPAAGARLRPRHLDPRRPRFAVSMALWRTVSARRGRFTAGALRALLVSAGVRVVTIDPAVEDLGWMAVGEV